jgi:5-methylcytosine-specific restriction endonuclease McrA
VPYKDPATRRKYQREYQRRWWAERRAAWFAGKSCAECGNTEDLELDHIDPALKVSSVIWSWTAGRREAELAKCRALCRDCHKKKSVTEVARGEQIGVAKLTEERVRAIRSSPDPSRALARKYGVSEKAIRLVRLRKTWAHVA